MGKAWTLTLLSIALLGAVFLIFPLSALIIGAHTDLQSLTTTTLAILQSSFYTALTFRSISLALLVTALVTGISLPLSYIAARIDFRLTKRIPALLLLVTVLPPFVGVLGARKMLGRSGLLPTLLVDSGILSDTPNLFGNGSLIGVALLQALHLFPLMTLLLLGAWQSQDLDQINAVKLHTSSRLTRLRHLTIPLLFPIWLYSALLVAMGSVADIGTPVMLNYRLLLPVYLFESLTDSFETAIGFTLVGLMSLSSIIVFYFVGRLYYRAKIDSSGRTTQPVPQHKVGRLAALLIGLCLTLLFGLALSPHIGVLLLAFIPTWIDPYPSLSWSLQSFSALLAQPLVWRSLGISLALALAATIFSAIVSLLLTFHAFYYQGKFSRLLLAVALIPLAVPGVAFAFGYLSGFRGTFLDPVVFPLPLLMVAYTIRKLPYLISASQGAYKTVGVELIDVGRVTGASLSTVWFRIVLPLISRPLIAGAALTFVFCMMEVSDSLILAREERYYPIAKAIYTLANRPDGPSIACAFASFLTLILLPFAFIGAHLASNEKSKT